MIGALAKRLFGSANDRVIKSLKKTVDAINALEPELEGLSDPELRARTDRFRERIAGGESLDDLLVEAFATVREAAKRTLGQRHFDVQLMGGMVLHQGKIAEMKTGEGKTLVATLAVYLNSLAGQGAHVVTVNDYLARRDAAWMGQIYEFLGLSVGCIVPGLDEAARKRAYAADITYGTNNEFGFDYLRDNMKFSQESMVQRGFNFAIVDEVDSILVDEARTPLIISGPSEDSSELYRTVDSYIPRLEAEDYEKDEKGRTVSLTESGTEKMEAWLAEAGLLKHPELYDIANVTLVHHVNQALRAHRLFTRDVDYLVKNGKVVIVDEFTGRMMEGRRYSDGLHQALEAKEKVAIQPENQTLASITFQNFFRLYPKLAGMTGTAATEASEFAEIYGLEVVEVPTHMTMIRVDEDDEVYRTAGEKNKAIVASIAEAHGRGQPILVGTVSIEKSEQLSELLKKEKIAHQVLNARYHEQEAFIVAQAGRLGGVTIATNMAGRGTDIQLGGNAEMRKLQELADVEDEAERTERAAAIEREIAAEHDRVIEAGGLYVLATERHEFAPHRQPAARPLRPSGRPRPLQVLPVARRRPDADLRLRAHGRHARQARPQGGRGDHPSLDQQGAREGAAEGRGAQLRDPQESPEVRRRHERPAQGDLRAAPRADRGQGGRRYGARHALPGDRRPDRGGDPGEGLPRAVGRRGAGAGLQAPAGARAAGRRMGQGGGYRRRRDQGADRRRVRPQDGAEGSRPTGRT